jgi:hypothetical protein
MKGDPQFQSTVPVYEDISPLGGNYVLRAAAVGNGAAAALTKF